LVPPGAVPAPGNKKPAGEGGCDGRVRPLSGGGAESPRSGLRLLPPQFLQGERHAGAIGDLAHAALVTNIARDGFQWATWSQSAALLLRPPNGMPVGASPCHRMKQTQRRKL